MASFWDRLMVFYRQGSVVTKLIFINTGIFLLLRLIVGVLALFRLGDKAWLDWLLVPATFPALLQRPWTLFTYAFVHYDLMHLLMNMLWLYFFGLLFQRWFSGIQLVVHYLVGGLAGGLLFMQETTRWGPPVRPFFKTPSSARQPPCRAWAGPWLWLRPVFFSHVRAQRTGSLFG